MHARALPNPLIVALAVAALLSLALLPTPTLGAKGSGITVGLERLIGQVSPGGLAAFEASFANGGNSTITNLSFTFRLSGGVVTAPTGCSDLGDARIGCPLGNIASGGDVRLRLIVQPGAGASGVTIAEGRFSADARQGNPNSTKSDIWPDPQDPALTATISVDGEAGNYFGTWQEPHGNSISGISVGSPARQRTSVSIPPVTAEGYPLVLGQVAVDGAVCGFASEFGDEVDLQVANGDRPGGVITVVLEYTREASDRRNANQVGVLHDCEPVAPCSTSAAPCYTASSFGQGQNRGIRIQLFLLENGKIRGV